MWKQRQRVRKLKRRHMRGEKTAPCCHCGRTLTFEEATLDHIIPRCDGGRYTFANTALACEDCNTERGNEDFHTFNGRKKAEAAVVSLVR